MPSGSSLPASRELRAVTHVFVLWAGGVEFRRDATGQGRAKEEGTPLACFPGPLRSRVAVELVEADVEIGFNLVDMARREFESGRSTAATRVLQDADDVLIDIEQRLSRLDDGNRDCFGPLLAELRRELSVAKSWGAVS